MKTVLIALSMISSIAFAKEAKLVIVCNNGQKMEASEVTIGQYKATDGQRDFNEEFISVTDTRGRTEPLYRLFGYGDVTCTVKAK